LLLSNQAGPQDRPDSFWGVDDTRKTVLITIINARAKIMRASLAGDVEPPSTTNRRHTAVGELTGQ
jgi:hypothetical protein